MQDVSWLLKFTKTTQWNDEDWMTSLAVYEHEDGTRWILACNSYILIALAHGREFGQDSEGASIVLEPGVYFHENIQRLFNATPERKPVDLKELRQWLGIYEFEHRKTCGNCMGTKHYWCNHCGQEATCDHCDADGKMLITPETRPGLIEGAPVDRNKLAQALCFLPYEPAEYGATKVDSTGMFYLYGQTWRVLLACMQTPHHSDPDSYREEFTDFLATLVSE